MKYSVEKPKACSELESLLEDTRDTLLKSKHARLITKVIQKAKEDPEYHAYGINHNDEFYKSIEFQGICLKDLNVVMYQHAHKYNQGKEVLTRTNVLPLELRDQIDPLLRFIPADIGEKMLGRALWHIHMLLAWEQHNCPIYDVDKSLSWVFLNTELADLPVKMIALPYPSFIIRLKNLEEAMIGSHRVKFDNASIHIPSPAICSNRQIWSMYVEGRSTDNNTHSYMLRCDFPLDSEKPLAACIQEDVLNKSINVGVEGLELVRRAIYYCINVMLYVTAKNSDDILRATSLEYLKLERRAIKAKGPAKIKFREQLAKLSPAYVHVLGSTTVIDRKKTDIDISSSNKEGVARVGHFVCGHWHHYWVGEGRKERIRKLIMPFWRGAPPTEEQLAETHKYLLK